MRRPPKLATIPVGSHPAAAIIRDEAEHGVPINLPQEMDKEEREASIRYGTHTSAIKEVEFIHAELANQMQAGHVAVFM